MESYRFYTICSRWGVWFVYCIISYLIDHKLTDIIMKLLHLLNGDATRVQFKRTDIPGETAVWREILCEGPTETNLESDSFWTRRSGFLQAFSKFSYDRHFAKQRMLVLERNIEGYDEIVLWFEYDLFCQINLLGALSWLRGKGLAEQTALSLVCLGRHPDYEGLVGLGEIDAAHYQALFENRAPLTSEDLEDAHDIWEIYCSNDHSVLSTWTDKEEHPQFPYLRPAMFCHQRRFPYVRSGINEIEQAILELLVEATLEKKQIVGSLLRKESCYGFGDIQYYKFMEGLAPLLEEQDGRIGLNEWGRSVVARDMDFSEVRTGYPTYGGVSARQYRWDEERKRLVLS